MARLTNQVSRTSPAIPTHCCRLNGVWTCIAIAWLQVRSWWPTSGLCGFRTRSPGWTWVSESVSKRVREWVSEWGGEWWVAECVLEPGKGNQSWSVSHHRVLLQHWSLERDSVVVCITPQGTTSIADKNINVFHRSSKTQYTPIPWFRSTGAYISLTCTIVFMICMICMICMIIYMYDLYDSAVVHTFSGGDLYDTALAQHLFHNSKI